MFKILALLMPTSSVSKLISALDTFAERLEAAEREQTEKAAGLESAARNARAEASTAGRAAAKLRAAAK